MASDNLNIIQNPQQLKSILYQYPLDGWFIFPVGKDKKPLTEHGFKDATQTQLGIDEYLRKYPGCNWAGYFPGQLIIDIDPRHGGTSQALKNKYGALPRTRTHRTGGGGLHVIYRQPPEYNIGNTAAMDGLPGIDRRGNGGYIVLPPSIHQSGKPYIVVDNSPITEAPISLLQVAIENKQTFIGTNEGEIIPQGQQDIWLFSRARGYRARGDTDDIIFQKIKLDLGRCPQNPARPYTDADLLRIAKSASKYSINDMRKNSKQERKTKLEIEI